LNSLITLSNLRVYVSQFVALCEFAVIVVLALVEESSSSPSPSCLHLHPPRPHLQRDSALQKTPKHCTGEVSFPPSHSSSPAPPVLPRQVKLRMSAQNANLSCCSMIFRSYQGKKTWSSNRTWQSQMAEAQYCLTTPSAHLPGARHTLVTAHLPPRTFPHRTALKAILYALQFNNASDIGTL
jgi:hypothetical protein